MHHNRKCPRLKGFSYSSRRNYFVTSVIKGRHQYFGEVIHGEMTLNLYGQIAHQQMIWLQEQYPYIQIPVWVIMPDHVHAIISIRGSIRGGRDRSRPVPTTTDGSTDITKSPTTKIKTLSSLMGAYKTTSSKQIHLAGLKEFRWQRSFHDRIIRNMREYWIKFQYIRNNPNNWNINDINK